MAAALCGFAPKAARDHSKAIRNRPERQAQCASRSASSGVALDSFSSSCEHGTSCPCSAAGTALASLRALPVVTLGAPLDRPRNAPSDPATDCGEVTSSKNSLAAAAHFELPTESFTLSPALDCVSSVSEATKKARCASRYSRFAEWMEQSPRKPEA